VHSIHRYVLPPSISSSAYHHIAENGLDATGLTSLSIEALHSCLIQIQQYVLNDPSLVKVDQFEQLLALLQKGYRRHPFHQLVDYFDHSLEYPIGNATSLILLPILHPSKISSRDLTSTERLSDSSQLSTSVVGRLTLDETCLLKLPRLNDFSGAWTAHSPI
jgi:hypothetical protein